MVFTWLYNSTGGSILLAVVFHAVFNWLSAAAGASSAIAISVPVAIWALSVARRYGPENLSPLPKHTG